MIRILIADDHAIVRAGLKQFIADEPDMVVAGEAETGGQALGFVRAEEYDIVLLDIFMPDCNGVDTLRSLKQVKPELPVLILSGFSDTNTHSTYCVPGRVATSLRNLRPNSLSRQYAP